MTKKNSYLDFLVEELSILGEIRPRAMFGGHGLYCDGVFFALVGRGALFLKADDVNRPRFIAEGLKAFRPFENKEESMSYYEAPAEMFEDPAVLKSWAGGAVEAGLRGQAKKKPKKKRL